MNKSKRIAVSARAVVLTVLFAVLPYFVAYSQYPYVRLAPSELILKAALTFFFPAAIVGFCLGYYGASKVKEEKRLAIILAIFGLILYVAIFTRFSLEII